MAKYTKEELIEALKSTESTLNKCKKAFPKLKQNSSQQTLLSRRINALSISITLIKREISNCNID